MLYEVITARGTGPLRNFRMLCLPFMAVKTSIFMLLLAEWLGTGRAIPGGRCIALSGDNKQQFGCHPASALRVRVYPVPGKGVGLGQECPDLFGFRFS